MHSSKLRILFSLLLVLLLCFSMSFSAFADGSDDGSDETVLDGYYVDDVPYDTNFDTVLTASSFGSQIYSASEHKTYNSPSVVSAPDTSSDSIYYYKSVTDFIPVNIWRGSNSPTITYPLWDGHASVQFVWAAANVDRTFYHQNEASSFSKLKWGRKYRVSFTTSFSVTSGYFCFYLANATSPDTPLITLFEASSANLQNSGKFVSIDFTCPADITRIVPVIKGSVGGSDTQILFFVNDFTITDITTEDLDNSLGKFGDKIKGFFDNLVESIKGFFIPEEGFFDDVKSRFDKLLSEHLGFLYEAPSIVGSIFGVVKDWSPPEQPTITLPAFNFDIGNDHIHLWDEQVYTFDFLANQPWSTLYAFYKTFIFVLLSVAMINLAIKKYHSIIGGGDSDDN